MANPFDQFDGQAQAAPVAATAGGDNPFNQFDHAQEAKKDGSDETISNFLHDAGHHIARLAFVGAKGFNDSIINTLAIPNNAITELVNKITGSNHSTPSQMWQGYSDKTVAPPTDLVEQVANTGGAFAGGAAFPLPHIPAGAAPVGQLADSVLGARAAGYVMPKSAITGKGGVAEQLMGAKALAADASRRNNAQMADNIGSQFGLPKGTEITHDVMDKVRETAGKAYKAISDLSPAYASVIDKIKSLRSDAQGYYRQVSTNYDHDVAKKADDLWDQAQNLEAKMANNLKIDTSPDVYDNFVAARKTIAQTHDVDKAIVDSRGELNPTKFSQMYGKEKPLTGALMSAGRSAQAFGKAFTTKGGMAMSFPDAALVGSGAGLTWAMSHDPKLVLAAALGGATRYGARKLALSGPVQDMRLLSGDQKINALAQALAQTGVANQGSN